MFLYKHENINNTTNLYAEFNTDTKVLNIFLDNKNNAGEHKSFSHIYRCVNFSGGEFFKGSSPFVNDIAKIESHFVDVSKNKN